LNVRDGDIGDASDPRDLARYEEARWPLDCVQTGRVALARILCPTDFSEQARHAVEHAVVLGRWLKAAIIGQHVYQPVFAPIPGLPPPDQRVPDREVARVEAATRTWFTGAGADAAAIVVDVGSPARCIVERARSLPADLIALGTHGAGGVQRLLLGSVAEKVVRTAPCPVLTVPPHAAAAGASDPFRRIMCAVDFSESSVEGVRLAYRIAREADSVLTLVHVIEWPWHEPPNPALDELPPPQRAALSVFRQLAEQVAADRLREVTADIRLGTRPVCRVVHGRSHVEMLRIAHETNADLIVVGMHGRNPVDLLLLGSTTNQIVRRARCPVLTVRR
jgi:nucleotide-binding universal stress UspA family protein